MNEATAAVVTRYFSIVADLTSTEDELREVLHPDVVLVEHPNPIRPQGAETDLEACVAGFLAGKALLSHQAIDVHDMVVDGERVAVRSTWTGTVANDAGPLKAGTELTAHMGGFLTVRDGRISRRETYDCYEPFATG